MTDEGEDCECTNATTKTKILRNTNDKTMYAQQEHEIKQIGKMLEKQTITTTTTTEKTNGNSSEKRNGIDNNNTSIGRLASGVGDVSGIFKDDIPDAFGFNNEKSDKKKIIPIVARMPTERNAINYNMNHKNRGRALIFNHENFDIPHLGNRDGTKKDCNDLLETLVKLDFNVTIHNDYKLKEINQLIYKVSCEDHSDNDCLLVAILSHGDHGLLYAKDFSYKLESIVHYFTAHSCPSLAGKPKIFFIQACRGDSFDSGITMHKRMTEVDGESSCSFKIPSHADFLFAYSTIPGYYSWRSPQNGSWFIQALVSELEKNAKILDILTLLTFVNQHVAFDYESYVPDNLIMNNQKQIPCVTSMLTRILVFNDKSREDD